MAITIRLLATELNISVNYLICQFSELGIRKTDLDNVTPDERKILFDHMNRDVEESGNLKKLTLQRKTLSTLRILSGGGRTKKVQVEVRKKHTYVQCDNKGFQHKKESDIFLDFNNRFNNDVLSNVVAVQEEDKLLSYKKDARSDLNVFIETIETNHNNTDEQVSDQVKQDKIKEVFLDSKRTKKTGNLSQHDMYNQYEMRIQHKSSLLKKKENNLISDISSEKSKILENNDKKKISNDRRVRNRQRIHSVKFRNHSDKESINIRYRKNNHLNMMKYEYDELHTVVRGAKNKQRKPIALTHEFHKPTQVVVRDVVIGEMTTVSELANKMAVKSSHVIKMMMQLGAMVTINQVIDQNAAQLIAEEMGHRVILRRENHLEEMLMNDRGLSSSGSASSELEYRAPVVAIMGHVDHGKTSLLDYIRSSNIANSEAGGITQHIGAYCVEIPYGSDKDMRMITFLDTPGHEAFAAMRLRGLQMTDIVVLVVAIDDGVMLQTIEAIKHIKNIKIPVIVALNKIDKLEFLDIDRIKHDLSKEGIISEEWGGDTQFINISAKLGIGVDNLLNAILLESEMLNLKVSRKSMASGVVIESFLDRGKGPVANILVREGTLRCGDVILCGLEYGRVRSMRNVLGKNIHLAGPSIPVEVFGLSGTPLAGDCMVVVRDERKAREVALYRQGKFRAVKLARKKKSTLENAMSGIVNDKSKILGFNVVLKADVQGSIEAISDVLNSFSTSKIKVNIVGSGVGRINETDVSLAVATGSVLLGFNVRSDLLSRKMIASENLDVYYFSVIYELIDNVKKLIGGILSSSDQKKRRNIALAEVRDIFCLPKLGNIAGCIILEGVVRRNNKVRILRKEIVVHEGELSSLRRFKDDVNEVRAGMECGIVIKNYTDVRSGDFIEVFD